MAPSSAANLETRMSIGKLLQETLYDLSVLARIVKQARWNVVGPAFLSFHVYLDGLSALLDRQVDSVAEVITALGMPSCVQATEVSAHSLIWQIPSGFLMDSQVADLLTDRGTCFLNHVWARRAALEHLDNRSSDALNELFHSVDRYLRRLPTAVQSAA